MTEIRDFWALADVSSNKNTHFTRLCVPIGEETGYAGIIQNDQEHVVVMHLNYSF